MILIVICQPSIGGDDYSSPTPDSYISKDLLDPRVVFAATGIEPEYSKYASAAKILRELADHADRGGPVQFNLPEIMKEINELYNFSPLEERDGSSSMIEGTLLQASAWHPDCSSGAGAVAERAGTQPGAAGRARPRGERQQAAAGRQTGAGEDPGRTAAGAADDRVWPAEAMPGQGRNMISDE